MDGKPFVLGAALSILAGILILSSGTTCFATDREAAQPERIARTIECEAALDRIAESIPSISAETKLRRSLAQATFCLPQNTLGILLYAALQASGNVLATGQMNEMTVVVTKPLIGASLGRYIFLPCRFLTEETVRHEYGHTLQGYKHGPFYLLLEGATSFIQASISYLFPAFARDYYDRWPENEADDLGGVDRD